MEGQDSASSPVSPVACSAGGGFRPLAARSEEEGIPHPGQELRELNEITYGR